MGGASSPWYNRPGEARAGEEAFHKDGEDAEAINLEPAVQDGRGEDHTFVLVEGLDHAAGREEAVEATADAAAEKAVEKVTEAAAEAVVVEASAEAEAEAVAEAVVEDGAEAEGQRMLRWISLETVAGEAVAGRRQWKRQRMRQQRRRWRR